MKKWPYIIPFMIVGALLMAQTTYNSNRYKQAFYDGTREKTHATFAKFDTASLRFDLSATRPLVTMRGADSAKNWEFDGGKLYLKDSLSVGAGSVYFRKWFYNSADTSVGMIFYNTTLARLDTIYGIQPGGDYLTKIASSIKDSLDAYRTSYKLDTTKIDTAQWGKFVRDHEATDASWAAAISDSLGRYVTNYLLDTTKVDTAQWGKFVRDHETNHPDWASAISDSLSRYVTNFLIDTTAIDTAMFGKFVRDHQSESTVTGIDAAALTDSLDAYRTSFLWDTTKVDTSQWGKFVRDHESSHASATGITEAALTDSLDAYRTSFLLDTTKIDTAQWGKFVRDHEASPDGVGVLAAALTDSLDAYRTSFLLDTTKVDTSQWGKFVRDHETNHDAWILAGAITDSLDAYRTSYLIDTTKIDTAMFGKFVRDHQSEGGSSGGLSEDDIDASSELAAIFDDETGTAGNIVFSISPTLSGSVKITNLATADTLLNLTNDKAGTADSVFKVTPSGGLRLSKAIQSWGGNARGTSAVDLQFTRGSATQVASGNYSFLIGYNNTASGAYAFAAGNSNTASGEGAFAIGEQNSATSGRSFAIGTLNTSSAYNTFAGGYSSTASSGSSFAYGYFTQTTKPNSFALGSECKTTMESQFAHGSGKFADIGDAQANHFVLRDTTVNTGTHVLKLDGVGGDDYLIIAATQALYFEGEVVAWCYSGTDDNEASAYKIEGLITRDGSNNTTLVWSSVTVKYEASGMEAADVTLAADDTNERLNISCLGVTGDTIRWVCSLRAVQVGG